MSSGYLRRCGLAAFCAFTITGAQAKEMQIVAEGLQYPEGPVYDGDTLLIADMNRGAIFAYANGALTVRWADANCGQTAAARLGSDIWIVACHLYRSIAFVKMTPGAPAQALTFVDFRRANDMSAGLNGVYVTSSGEFGADQPATGEVWLVRSPSDKRMVASGLKYANGVAVSGDRKSLLVSEHLMQKVWRYPIAEDGSLGARELAVDVAVAAVTGPAELLGALDGPDGIEAAGDGTFFVAVYGKGMVLHVGKGGKVLGRYETAGYPNVTNVALSPDGKRLYAVASQPTATGNVGALFGIDLPKPVKPVPPLATAP